MNVCFEVCSLWLCWKWVLYICWKCLVIIFITIHCYQLIFQMSFHFYSKFDFTLFSLRVDFLAKEWPFFFLLMNANIRSISDIWRFLYILDTWLMSIFLWIYGNSMNLQWYCFCFNTARFQNHAITFYVYTLKVREFLSFPKRNL